MHNWKGHATIELNWEHRWFPHGRTQSLVRSFALSLSLSPFLTLSLTNSLSLFVSIICELLVEQLRLLLMIHTQFGESETEPNQVL